jgi:hypothetical protein
MDIDWATRVITVFKTDSFMTALGGSSYNMDTNAFKRAVQDRLDDEDGQAFPDAFSHNTTVLLGGVEYARTIESLTATQLPSMTLAVRGFVTLQPQTTTSST